MTVLLNDHYIRYFLHLIICVIKLIIMFQYVGSLIIWFLRAQYTHARTHTEID